MQVSCPIQENLDQRKSLPTKGLREKRGNAWRILARTSDRLSPDFQGTGIGNAMSEFVASLFAATNKPYRNTTSHPAMLGHRLRSMNWNCVRTPGMGPAKSPGTISKSRAVYRLTASFEYIGPANFEHAEALGVMDCRDE